MIRKNWIPILSFLVLFACCWIFFSRICPLIPFDGDDWNYLSYARVPLPIWHDHNPARVFPEILMPLCGYASAYFIRPWTGNIVSALTIGGALFVSAGILFMAYEGYRFLRSSFTLSQIEALLLMLFNVCCYFIIYYHKIPRHLSGDQLASAVIPFLFAASNYTCIFYYVLSALLNIGVIFLLLRQKPWKNEGKFSLAGKGFLILGIYLAIFSNLFESILIASFALSLLLLSVKWKGKISLRSIWKDHKGILVIILAALLSAVFEANGGNAKDIQHSLSLTEIKMTGIVLGDALSRVSYYVMPALILLPIVACLLYKKKKVVTSCNAESYVFIEKLSLLSLAFTFVGLYLISVKAGAHYIRTNEVLLSLYFWLFLLDLGAAAFLVSEYKAARSSLPVLVLFPVMLLINSLPYFQSVGGYPEYVKRGWDEQMVSAIKEADARHETEVTLIVPDFRNGDSKKDNWPFPNYYGKRVARTLYAFGETHTLMTVHIKPQAGVKDQFEKGGWIQ